MPLVPQLLDLHETMLAWRHDFHQHPELGFEEHRTASIIADRLKAFGVDEVHSGIGKTGVVGVLHGKDASEREDQAIMLRSDIDALPIDEINDFAHRSKTPGQMHACGHDGHMSMLLGAAKHLAETRNFSGTVYLNFQPAEEGLAGALAMIEDGLFDRFPTRSVYGMHNWPGLPVGSIRTTTGPIMASADEFRIVVKGQGGHAGQPHLCYDPVVVAAAIIQSLQTIVSRRTDPLGAAVISTTTLKGGSAYNIIPEEAVIGGTVRSLDDEYHEEVHRQIIQMATNIASAYDMTAETSRPLEFYPVTVNDEAQAAFCQSVAAEIMSEDSLATNVVPSMSAEDFSFYAREKPSCFVWCGNGDTAGLHNPAYDFDDSALVVGASYWVRLVEKAHCL